jgi:hypothetical protein
MFAAIQTRDSGFAFLGSTSTSGAGNSDICLVKTNSHGDLEWVKTYGDTAEEIAFSFLQTQDNGFIISGHSTSFGAGFIQAYIIKTDLVGNVVWSNIYTANRDCNANCIKATSDGGYIVTGSSVTFGSLNENIYLLKIDSAGNEIWSKSFGVQVDSDIGTYVDQTADGGYILTGLFQETSVFLIKTNSMGDTSWTKVYTGGSIEFAYFVHQTSDSGYIVSGIASYSTLEKNGFILKTDSAGSVVWAKLYGTPADDYFVSATFTNDQCITAAGFSNYFGTPDAYIVKVDFSGNVLWGKAYGTTGFEGVQSISQAFDSGYIAAGGSANNLGYLLKTGSQGENYCDHAPLNITISNIPVQSHSFGMTNPSITTIQNNFAPMIGNGINLNTICADLGAEAPIARSGINVSPNPTPGNSLLYIPDFRNGKTMVTIISVSGELLFSAAVTSQVTLLDLEKYSNGYYFVEIRDENTREFIPLVIVKEVTR